MIGLSPVHVNRSLRPLRSEGMIAWRSRNIALLRPQALAEMCDFDPRYLQVIQRPLAPV